MSIVSVPCTLFGLMIMLFQFSQLSRPGTLLLKLFPLITQGVVTPIYPVLAATTMLIKMAGYCGFTDVHRKLVTCTSMHGNIQF